MGRQKLLAPFRGRPLIEYAIEAARAWQPVVIASGTVAEFLAQRDDVQVIVNDAPDLGMSHSLALADESLPAGVPLIVLLADKPLITHDAIARVWEACGDADVVYPVSESGEPGHPVIFSLRARAKIRELPAGDSIRLLRDDLSLARRMLQIADRGAFFDVDTAEQFE